MSTERLDDPAGVVTFEKSKAHVLVEHEGTLFLVPRYLVAPEPAPTPGGTCTVVAVDRKAGEVTVSGHRSAGSTKAAAEALKAIYGRVSPGAPLGSNRKARRAAASAGRMGR